jgi:diacylglycerol kinase (ATP)
VKNKAFHHRLRFAWEGLRAAFKNEASFRTEVLAAVGAIAVTAWLHPPALWLALVIVIIALVLAAELFNTALEHLLDGLHPEQAEFVRIAKDCSAAAVLVFSFTSAVVFVLMLVEVLGNLPD